MNQLWDQAVFSHTAVSATVCYHQLLKNVIFHNGKYKQKSYVELLVYFITDSYTFNEEYKQNSYVELPFYFLTDFLHF